MATNPIVNTPRPSRFESSSLRSPRDSADQSRQWRKAEADARQLGGTQGSVQHMQRQIDSMKRRNFSPHAVEMYPFRVFTSPYNPTPADPDDWWRTFRVRGGRYGTVAVDLTDGGHQNADDLRFDPNPDYDATIDFVVPVVTPGTESKYYVWVDITDAAAPVIGHSATIPGGGTDDDWWGTSYVLVAVIDVSTYAADYEPVVDQYVRYHIPKCL